MIRKARDLINHIAHIYDDDKQQAEYNRKYPVVNDHVISHLWVFNLRAVRVLVVHILGFYLLYSFL